MKLWRISNYADLKGIGGTKVKGRWHNKGIPVVYLAESPSLALLETLVHFELDPDEIPENFQLLEVEYEGRKGVQRLTATLTPDWTDDLDYTRTIGDEWLTNLSGVLLKVPSVLVPHSFNYLFNPRHPLAKNARILSVEAYPFDNRLLTTD